MIIAKQRGNADKAIASLATEIVVKWKKVVEEEKAKRQKMNGITPAKKGSASSPSSSQAATPASATPVPVAKGFTGDPNLRKFASDGLKPDIYPDKGVRNGCVILIYNGLAFVS